MEPVGRLSCQLNVLWGIWLRFFTAVCLKLILLTECQNTEYNSCFVIVLPNFRCNKIRRLREVISFTQLGDGVMGGGGGGSPWNPWSSLFRSDEIHVRCCSGQIKSVFVVVQVRWNPCSLLFRSDEIRIFVQCSCNPYSLLFSWDEYRIHCRSVKLTMALTRSGKPICAPPHLLEVSPQLPFKQFQCWSDWRCHHRHHEQQSNYGTLLLSSRTAATPSSSSTVSSRTAATPSSSSTLSSRTAATPSSSSTLSSRTASTPSSSSTLSSRTAATVSYTHLTLPTMAVV